MRRAGVLVTLVVVLATAVWWMFLISPKNGQIADLRDQVNASIDSEQRLRGRISELETIQNNEVEYLAALGKLDALIPERPLLEEFIEQIYELSNETGVDLQTLAPSVPAPAEDSELREVSVSAQIEGAFFEVLGFLFGLNDMERLVRVDSVSVSTSTDEVAGTILSTSIDMTLFTLADLLPLSDALAAATPDASGDTAPAGDGVEARGAGG